MNSNVSTISENYQRVLEKIDQAAASAGRNAAQVKLVVVTKGHDVAAIQQVIEAGARDLGENRVEEAENKMPAVSSQSGVQWHMIGHVQSRKARPVMEYFNYLHSLDRLKLARRLDQSGAELSRTMPSLLEFNVSGEATKSGWQAVDEAKWPALAPEIEAVLALERLEVRGLMTMAPYSLDPEDARPVFAKLRRLRDHLAKHFPQTAWDELSMGMSGDYEVGIQEGATFVRIGTAILGARY
jgi:pyridoxal phosphate enzyme (YggS family)